MNDDSLARRALAVFLKEAYDAEIVGEAHDGIPGDALVIDTLPPLPR